MELIEDFIHMLELSKFSFAVKTCDKIYFWKLGAGQMQQAVFSGVAASWWVYLQIGLFFFPMIPSMGRIECHGGF